MMIVYSICSFLLSLSLLAGLYRLIRGPGLLNRILAFDLISICIIAFVILFSLITDVYHYLEITLIFCLLGFITTIAFMDILFRSLARKEKIHE